MSTMKGMRVRWLGVLSEWVCTWCVVRAAGIATLCFCLVTAGDIAAGHPEVSPIDFELDGPGENVDDPCFWVDPADLADNNQPLIDGPALDTVGVLAPGDTMEFDVSAAVAGDGTYVFAVVGTVDDATVYRSREASPSAARPLLLLVPRGQSGGL